MKSHMVYQVLSMYWALNTTGLVLASVTEFCDFVQLAGVTPRLQKIACFLLKHVDDIG